MKKIVVQLYVVLRKVASCIEEMAASAYRLVASLSLLSAVKAISAAITKTAMINKKAAKGRWRKIIGSPRDMVIDWR